MVWVVLVWFRGVWGVSTDPERINHMPIWNLQLCKVTMFFVDTKKYVVVPMPQSVHKMLKKWRQNVQVNRYGPQKKGGNQAS